MGEAAIDPLAFLGTHVRDYVNTCLTQTFNAPSRNQWIRVGHTDDHALDTGSNDGIGAWRCLAVMGAWFERNVHRGIGGDALELAKRMCLGMRTAKSIMPSFGNDPVLMHDDASNTRVWRYASGAPSRKLEGMVHIVFVCQRCGGHVNSTEA